MIKTAPIRGGGAAPQLYVNEQRGVTGQSRSIVTPSFVLQPLHRHQQRLLLVQLTLQEGVPLDGLVQALLEVLQGHDGRPGDQRRRRRRGEGNGIKQSIEQAFESEALILNPITAV